MLLAFLKLLVNFLNKNRDKRTCTRSDIAPTIANLLQIEFPNGTTGKIIEGALK